MKRIKKGRDGEIWKSNNDKKKEKKKRKRRYWKYCNAKRSRLDVEKEMAKKYKKIRHRENPTSMTNKIILGKKLMSVYFQIIMRVFTKRDLQFGF